jgi:glutaminyl-tRNA synthetase
VVRNEAGEVIEVHATYDPATRGGDSPDGRKVKSTIHWVSAEHAQRAEVRLYKPLFTTERPDDGDLENIVNPNSLEVVENAYVEPSLATTQPGDRFQFERQGYFCTDIESTAEKIVFNLTVNLKDTWAKLEKKGK